MTGDALGRSAPFDAPPLPPAELALRVGVSDTTDPLGSFDQVGRHVRELILELLGPDWSFDGKRVLDFGCGAGKVLRHFLAEAERAEVHGCDIDERSIRWIERNLSPPIHAFVNGPLPPLPLADGSFDLVLAMSVFTHLTAEWSAWLLELHRVLRDGGLMIATYLGRGMSQAVAGEEWVEERIGMNVLEAGRDWDRGGPNVLLSPWWIRAHWGRAFDVLRLDDNTTGHGVVLLRKRAATLSRALLERPQPDEPRELQALGHQVRQLERELSSLRARLERPAATPLPIGRRFIRWLGARKQAIFRVRRRGLRRRAHRTP